MVTCFHTTVANVTRCLWHTI